MAFTDLPIVSVSLLKVALISLTFNDIQDMLSLYNIFYRYEMDKLIKI